MAGSSLGGARPKASVVDAPGQLWIAKLPSGQHAHEVGAWEAVGTERAQAAGLRVATGRAQRCTSRPHPYLSQRVDRTAAGERRPFASAMTLLGYPDGTDRQAGASYPELAGLLVQQGAHVAQDLAARWRRIVFNSCVSNTDDHLRNQGFLLTSQGWHLAPAFDLNHIRYGQGLKRNISETDNALDLDLAREVAPYFRLPAAQAEAVLAQVVRAVRQWPAVASRPQLSRTEQDLMAGACAAAQ